MATDPLLQIQQHIGDARTLPEPRPYSPAPQPMERLLSLIEDARKGRDPDSELASTSSASDLPSSPTGATGPAVQSTNASTSAPGSLDALVGQQILASLEARPLSGPSRAETMRRLALAMQNPTQQNLQAVLDVLLSDDPSTGQSRQ